MLDGDGGGYRMGDVVEVTTKIPELLKGDVVLFDWRAAEFVSQGWGPGLNIGQIHRMPGDSFMVADMLNYRDFSGRARNLPGGWLRAHNVQQRDEDIVLSPSQYSVIAGDRFYILELHHIYGFVIKRVTHDSAMGKEFRHTIY